MKQISLGFILLLLVLNPISAMPQSRFGDNSTRTQCIQLSKGCKNVCGGCRYDEKEANIQLKAGEALAAPTGYNIREVSKYGEAGYSVSFYQAGVYASCEEIKSAFDDLLKFYLQSEQRMKEEGIPVSEEFKRYQGEIQQTSNSYLSACNTVRTDHETVRLKAWTQGNTDGVSVKPGGIHICVDANIVIVPTSGDLNLEQSKFKGEMLASAQALKDEYEEVYLTLRDATINTTEEYKAKQLITAGPAFEIAAPGNITFRSENLIRFVSGFKAKSGSKIKAYIDPSIKK